MNAESTGSLRKGCLNFSEVTSLAIALISPTMTAALIIPLMYSSAGNASWLAYLFGTVMLLFVALNLNQFARRSTSAGSMYAYTVMGLGTTAGGISGWCLAWAYLFIGTAGMTGFTIFANTLCGMMGFQVPNLVLFADLRGGNLGSGLQGHPAFEHPDALPRGRIGRADPLAVLGRALSSQLQIRHCTAQPERSVLLRHLVGSGDRDFQPGRIRVRDRLR